MMAKFYRKLDIEEEDIFVLLFLGGIILFIIQLWINKRDIKAKESKTKHEANETKLAVIIKYILDDEKVNMVRAASGFGLKYLMLVFEDYPGFCCDSCGPIFQVDIENKDKTEIQRCSLCGKELSLDEGKQINKFINFSALSVKKLGNLLVKCSEYRFGCNSVIQLKKLKEHLQFCPYVKVPCPQECGITIMRTDIPQHLNHFHSEPQGHSNTPLLPSCPPPPYPNF